MLRRKCLHPLNRRFDERGRVWVVLHSGSRGIGNRLAQKHIGKARKLAQKLELRLKAEVPKQDTTAIVEMQKRGLTVVKVAAADIEKYRATAQGFAGQMRGTAVPADILDTATRERDAFRLSRAKR